MMEDFPYTTIVSKILSKTLSTLLRSDVVCKPTRILLEHLGTSAKLLAIVVIESIELTPLLLILVVCLPLVLIDSLKGRGFLQDTSSYYQVVMDFADRYRETAYSSILFYFLKAVNGLERTWIVDIGKLLADTPFKPLNEEYTVSRSLSWLIQHCETPSSVAIALQAVAGANRKVPVGPLKECKSSEEILKRLVSSPSGQKAAQEATLYARALRFLVSRSLPNPQRDESGGGGKEDAAVMIWELKLQREE
ncbi:hypothetical protein RSOLAG1IB_11486 [Rhizoctonia solani AG-1 IB]|uniref:Uncharacterized protein n=1 Tax=Thanatephorus cucumeris (strain AG1-IB / isolate 7/3/14) TaxID=1108050 RepID=A0A0B7FA10_THACB|nr:hypothetical protein RSOLAG1IB_11486 [Rhizoctonia solani AG-1 IB]